MITYHSTAEFADRAYQAEKKLMELQRVTGAELDVKHRRIRDLKRRVEEAEAMLGRSEAEISRLRSAINDALQHANFDDHENWPATLRGMLLTVKDTLNAVNEGNAVGTPFIELRERMSPMAQAKASARAKEALARVDATPRTDEKEEWAADCGSGFVSADFARKLERELGAANARIATLQHELVDSFVGTERHINLWRDTAEAAQNQLAATNRALAEKEAEVAQCRKDAERYRWLRAQHWNKAGLFVVAGSKSQIRLGTDCPSLVRLDEAIDAAKESA